MEDHVREYGKDISGRICSSGFSVEEKRISYSEFDEERYGLYPGGEGSFFLCTK